MHLPSVPPTTRTYADQKLKRPPSWRGRSLRNPNPTLWCSSGLDLLEPCTAMWRHPGGVWSHCEGAPPASLLQLSLQPGGGWALRDLVISDLPNCCCWHSAASLQMEWSLVLSASLGRAPLVQGLSPGWWLRLWRCWRDRGQQAASQRERVQGDSKWVFPLGICNPGTPPPPHWDRAPGARPPEPASCPAPNPCHHLRKVVQDMKTLLADFPKFWFMILVFPNDEKCSQCKRRKTVRTEKVFFFNTINIETNHSKYPYRPICVFTFKQNTAFLDHLQNVSKSLRIQMAPIEKGFSQLPFNRERVSRGLVWHMEELLQKLLLLLSTNSTILLLVLWLGLS